MGKGFRGAWGGGWLSERIFVGELFIGEIGDPEKKARASVIGESYEAWYQVLRVMKSQWTGPRS